MEAASLRKKPTLTPDPATGSGEPILRLGLTPRGVVSCLSGEGAVAAAFARSEEEGLFTLGGRTQDGDDSCRYWKMVGEAMIRALCRLPEGARDIPALDAPDAATLTSWILDAPPMRGAEYLSPEVLRGVWERMEDWARAGARDAGGLAGFLRAYAPAWARVGRVSLRLAENASDPDAPFAFMASYASGVSQSGRLTQLPLGRALREYSGARNKPELLRLLEPLHRAAKTCPFMAELVESGDVFHPLAWTPREAHAFLLAIPACEDAGLLVRLPDWWKKRARRPRVAATVGQRKSAGLGLDALLDFRLDVEVDGQKLTRQEIDALLKGEDGLVLFRGQWIEVDREKLREALDHWKVIEAAGGVSFIEGMRMLAGEPGRGDAASEDPEREWSFARPGEWMEETLRALAEPTPAPPPASLRGTLRPYQAVGLNWLWFCARAGFGACLADDMGLGKTIQVLAALLRRKEADPDAAAALLVVPASLIGNWKREAETFAPALRVHVAHRSEGGGQSAPPPHSADVVITTYGMLARADWIARTRWGWIVLDEAQAVKNAASRQSRAVRALKADARFALTGTPVENHLGDLWALFDFLNPGLLGTAAQFQSFVKSLTAHDAVHYGPLRRLVTPYILRRLKTDRAIVPDLPDKTEMKVFCGLVPAQARLYQDTAAALSKELATATGIQRRGLVLAYLMRFKQICNHPDQLTKAGEFDPSRSAKFLRAAEVCAEIASRGEKALVFTQFRELTEPLAAFLATVFSRSGLILHGGTAVKERARLVQEFQREDGPPFFVLSLKAGGSGLNLTAASHVIHFDRWWNPAVENQATDRAFRIGQRRNVLVHKFITSGTLEERIDGLLGEKQASADALLDGGAEKALTEMSDSELLQFVRLDISRVENLT